MNEKGAPSPVAWTRVRAPQGSMDPTPADQIEASRRRLAAARQVRHRRQPRVGDREMAQTKPAQTKPATTTAEKADEYADRWADDIKKRTRRRRASTSRRQSPVEKAAGEAGRTLARELIKKISGDAEPGTRQGGIPVAVCGSGQTGDGFGTAVLASLEGRSPAGRILTSVGTWPTPIPLGATPSRGRPSGKASTTARTSTGLLVAVGARALPGPRRRQADLDLDEPIIDVGAGWSTLVDHLLARGYRDLTAIDLSATALQTVRDRLGPAGADVVLEVADVLDLHRRRATRLWHDRAVYHFLTEPDERDDYLASLNRSLEPDGWVVVATFGPDGPTTCSGLPIVRYTHDELAAQFPGLRARLHQRRGPRHALGESRSSSPRSCFAGHEGPLAHPTEVTDPCCLPALGELGDVSPREGLTSTIRLCRCVPGAAGNLAAEDSHSGLVRSLGKRVG